MREIPTFHDFRHADAQDGAVHVDVRAQEAEVLPGDSCFANLAESSRFFEGGSIGWSPGRDDVILDGLRLHTLRWSVKALAVDTAASSWFAKHLPAGSYEFDHALLMRDIPHEWHQEEPITLNMEERAMCGTACC